MLKKRWNGKTTKTTTLHVQHTILYVSLPLFCTITTWNFVVTRFMEEILYLFLLIFLLLALITRLHTRASNKCKCTWNLLWVWRGKMYLQRLYLVTMETFVVQRCRSSPPSMGYPTLENILDQKEMEAMCTMWTCSGSKILMFSTEQLRISKCTWIKCLLETNLTSSVKPSIFTLLAANIPHFFTTTMKFSCFSSKGNWSLLFFISRSSSFSVSTLM